MDIKAVYEAPGILVVSLRQNGIICQSPLGDNPLEDYNYGGLDEPDSAPALFGLPGGLNDGGLVI